MKKKEKIIIVEVTTTAFWYFKGNRYYVKAPSAKTEKYYTLRDSIVRIKAAHCKVVKGV